MNSEQTAQTSQQVAGFYLPKRNMNDNIREEYHERRVGFYLPKRNMNDEEHILFG